MSSLWLGSELEKWKRFNVERFGGVRHHSFRSMLVQKGQILKPKVNKNSMLSREVARGSFLIEISLFLIEIKPQAQIFPSVLYVIIRVTSISMESASLVTSCKCIRFLFTFGLGVLTFLPMLTLISISQRMKMRFLFRQLWNIQYKNKRKRTGFYNI